MVFISVAVLLVDMIQGKQCAMKNVYTNVVVNADLEALKRALAVSQGRRRQQRDLTKKCARNCILCLIILHVMN